MCEAKLISNKHLAHRQSRLQYSSVNISIKCKRFKRTKASFNYPTLKDSVQLFSAPKKTRINYRIQQREKCVGRAFIFTAFDRRLGNSFVATRPKLTNQKMLLVLHYAKALSWFIYFRPSNGFKVSYET